MTFFFRAARWRKHRVAACAGLLFFNSTFAQEYLWPTDASRFMTSSFGESRPRRFHAAIDIKTWNRTGYKVFATRKGYVERISVSPFGYGRALYLRLDNGETVVYAHLERFNERLQEIIEREQERQGAYRIEKYFGVEEVSVQQGELLAFTGQSGIGVPHLHFELRDAQSRPINPLHKNFGVTDNVAPSIKALAVTPLSAEAMIDCDFKPRVYQPVLRNGQLTLTQPIAISGKVGFAVDAFDRTTGVNNQVAVYRYQLYIDGSLQFQSQFDRFSYSENRLIELVQDYYLLRHDEGRFHKLYRETANTLEIYSTLNAAHGAILVAEANAKTAMPARSDAGLGLARGLHDFMIVAEDFAGNRTTVAGKLLAGAPYEITATPEEAQAAYTLFELHLPPDRAAREVTLHAAAEGWNGARKPVWRAAQTERMSSSGSLFEAQTLAALQHDSTALAQPLAPPVRIEKFRGLAPTAKLWRVYTQDEHGVLSLPAFVYAERNDEYAKPFHLEVKKEFYPKHLRLEIAGNMAFAHPPQVTFAVNGHSFPLATLPQEPNRYIAAMPLAQIAGDSVVLTITAASRNGAQALWEEKFSNVALTRERGGELESADGGLRVRFEPGALYEALYGRVKIAAKHAVHPLVFGPVYRVEPNDVPFRAQATIEIAYPDSVSAPGKLGLAVRNNDRWNFVASKRNTFARTLSAEVSSLDEYAVMKDDEAPLVVVQSPSANVRTKTRRPQITCRVADHLSGFKSERDIQLRLDGTLLIAEYDPERELVQWRPKNDLAPGTHVLLARAEDQCGNVTEREVKFVVP